MDNTFKSLISQSASILILLPKNPNFDQVAAGLSLYLCLKNQKETVISCPTPIVVEFNRLVGVDKISSDLGSKNLVISFKDYQATNIEKVSYDIEGGEFKLTIIPKNGFIAPTKEQTLLFHSGVSAHTVILIDGTDENSFSDLFSENLSSSRFLHIGTRVVSFKSNLEILSFARPASSISELVASLIKESGFGVDSDIATNLLWGIEAATDSFITKGVTAETFQIVADLIHAGGKRQELQMINPAQTFSQGAKPTQEQIMQQLQSLFPQGQVPVNPQAYQAFDQPKVNQQTFGQQIPPAGAFQPFGQTTTPMEKVEEEKIAVDKNQPFSQPQEGKPIQEVPQETPGTEPGIPPSDWLTPPKIFKGTSIS